MKKWLIGLGLILVLWFALKNTAFEAYLTRGPVVLPPQLDYDKEDSWASLPVTLPAGAWETPWGIDAFLILPPPNTPEKHGLLSIEDSPVLTDTLQALGLITPAIPGDLPVYAPFYRAPSAVNRSEVLDMSRELAATDLIAAFEHYLAGPNQGRGVLLIVAESAGPYTQPLLERLQSEDISDRFAGLVSLGPSNSDYMPQILMCADILGGACHQKVNTQASLSITDLLLPSVRHKAPELNIIDPLGVAAAIKVQAENVSLWMDESLPKPAEPFFATEVIESAPIFRPGAQSPIKD